MKSALLIALIFLGTVNASAQAKITPIGFQQDANGTWYYEKIFPVDNVAKKDLYERMKAWVLSNIKTVDNNILFDDANFETIITTPTLAIADTKGGWTTDQRMNFKLTLSFKDNKFKAYASSFFYFGRFAGKNDGGPIETFEAGKKWIRDVNVKFDESFIAFANLLTQAATAKAKSDW